MAETYETEKEIVLSQSIFDFLIKHGAKQAFELVEQKSDKPASPTQLLKDLFSAIKNSELKNVEACLKALETLDKDQARKLLETPDKNNESLLHFAIMYIVGEKERKRIFELLAENFRKYNANIDLKDTFGETALFRICTVKFALPTHTAGAKILLNNGADPNATDKQGISVLRLARSLQHNDIVKLPEAKIDELKPQQNNSSEPDQPATRRRLI